MKFRRIYLLEMPHKTLFQDEILDADTSFSASAWRHFCRGVIVPF